jgi:hypothetical protein
MSPKPFGSWRSSEELEAISLILKNDGSHYWIEAKGYMDAKSKTKIKRFNKYYPNEELRIIKHEDLLKI